jgi:hypothetical protein
MLLMLDMGSCATETTHLRRTAMLLKFLISLRHSKQHSLLRNRLPKVVETRRKL